MLENLRLLNRCFLAQCIRTLGTPTDDIWPGVKALPDYKSSFPQWNGVPLSKAVPSLDESGLDLLKGMLIYDPAGRVSGE